MKKSVIVAGLLAATFAITPAKADKLDDFKISVVATGLRN